MNSLKDNPIVVVSEWPAKDGVAEWSTPGRNSEVRKSFFRCSYIGTVYDGHITVLMGDLNSMCLGLSTSLVHMNHRLVEDAPEFVTRLARKILKAIEKRLEA